MAWKIHSVFVLVFEWCIDTLIYNWRFTTQLKRPLWCHSFFIFTCFNLFSLYTSAWQKYWWNWEDCEGVRNSCMSAFVKDFAREHAVFYPPVTCFDMPLGNLTAPNSNHSFCARTATGTLLFSSHYIQQPMRWTRMHLYWGLTMTTCEICCKFWRCCDTVKIMS